MNDLPPKRRRRRRRLMVAAVAVGLLAVLVWAGKDWLVARFYLAVLESDHRVRGLQIERVIETLEISSGARIADIGAGTGLFARPFAIAAGNDGIVYAIDINRELLSHVERTAREQGLDNLRIVLAATDDPQLPEPVGLVFICDTLHHIEQPDAYLKTLRRYLLPRSRIAVIDFREGESPHLDRDLRYSESDLRRWMEEAGYRLEATHDFVEENFFLVWRCDDCPGGS